MSTHSNTLMEEQLEALNVAYQAALPNKLDELQEAVSGIFEEEGPENIRKSLDLAASLSHKIAGSAAMFGHESVSDSARALDDICSSLLVDGEVAQDDAKKTEICDLLLRMQSAATASIGEKASASQTPGETNDDDACGILFIDDGS